MDRFITYLQNHENNIIFGIILSIFTYFAEIRGSVTVMAVAFLVDLIFGIWNSISVKKEKFQMGLFFNQLKRFLIVLVIVMLVFAMDKENGQDLATVYAGVTYLVTGFLIWSIAENGFSLTGWNLFLILKNLIKKKVENVTEVDITEKHD